MRRRVAARSRIGIPTSKFTSIDGSSSSLLNDTQREAVMAVAARAATDLQATPDAALRIETISARAVIAPLTRPIRTAVGHVPSAPLVLIDVRATHGVVGRSYLFGYTPLALRPLV